jgi:predicted N-formylglutamate amidohydrolase
MIEAAISSDTQIPSDTQEGYRVLAGRTDAGIVLLCDHASNALPTDVGTLGLSPDQLQRHIAYDIGAAAITESLAARLGAPAILSCHSRLLIDINRGADDPTLIMRLSDGAVVPGNHNLSPAARAARIDRYWRPYHQAVSRVILACRAGGRRPIIFSVHSMTNIWKGVPRPWHVSILWNEDRHLAGHLLDGFSADSTLVVGDNVPYHGGLEGDTLWQHARPHGLPNALIEYRQDLVADAAGQAHWTDRTYRILNQILSDAAFAAPTHSNPGVLNVETRSQDPDRIGSRSVPAPGRASA